MARDVDKMTAVLRRYLARGKALTRIVPLSTGHSNETYLLEGIDRVLRMPPSAEGLLPPYDMARQHAILQAMGRHPRAPPVPRVFELECDPAVLGDPFFLMEYLDGEVFEYRVPDWLEQAPESVRTSMSQQWVTAISQVHCLPPSLMPAGARTVAEEIEHWRAVARKAEAEPSLHALLDELAAHPPHESGAMTPLHGDAKQGNCIWSRKDRGRLLGLLDWEMAGIGDPMLDLGYLLQWYEQGDMRLVSAGLDLPGWWQRDRMIEEWQHLTGRSARDARRFEAIGMCKTAALLALGHHLFRTGCADDPRFESWGPIVGKYVALAQRRSQMPD